MSNKCPLQATRKQGALPLVGHPVSGGEQSDFIFSVSNQTNKFVFSFPTLVFIGKSEVLALHPFRSGKARTSARKPRGRRASSLYLFLTLALSFSHSRSLRRALACFHVGAPAIRRPFFSIKSRRSRWLSPTRDK